MLKQIRPALALFLSVTIIIGVAYPCFVWSIGHLFFQDRAEGSLIKRNGVTIGSSLIGQHFEKDEYFWPRPVANSQKPYSFLDARASNQSPLDQALLDRVEQERQRHLLHDNNTASIPIDLVTASGSGLDPDISPASAYVQAQRIAAARHVSGDQVREIIKSHIQPRTFGFLGEERVNVLELNIALDLLLGGKSD